MTNYWMIVAGFVLMLFELLFGAITGFDVFFLGIGFIAGGTLFLCTGFTEYSMVTVGIVFIAYAVYLRPSYRKALLLFFQKHGLDCIVGKYGLTTSAIDKQKNGAVIVDGELWIAASSENIKAGLKVIVLEYSENALVVAKPTKPTLEV
jgi:membrane protein implicated in regulation of membrane protease activity